MNNTNSAQTAVETNIVKGVNLPYVGMPVRIESTTSKHSGKKAQVVQVKTGRVSGRATKVTVKVWKGSKTQNLSFEVAGSLASAE